MTIVVERADTGAENAPVTLRERLKALRYRFFPDHLLGEILSKKWADNAAPFLFLILTIGIFGTIIPDLFEPNSMTELMRQLGEFGIVVLGFMIVLGVGGIDLSVGSNFALANLIALGSINLFGLSPLTALLLAVSASSAVGFVNGLLVGYLRLRAFLTTLVTLILVRSLIDMLLLKYAVQISSSFVDNELWFTIGEGSFLGLPVSLIVFATLAVAVHLLLSRISLGWRIMAVGGSRRSAHNVGIGVPRIICISYTLCGLFAGIAGFLYATRLSSVGADTGVGLEIAVLSAAVLGGNSLGGGRGSAAKAVMGAIIVLVVTTSIVRLGFRSGASQIALGSVLMLAVVVDVRWMKNRDKLLNKFYVSPGYFRLPKSPETAAGSDSPYALNDKLRSVQVIGLGKVEGPEDVILDRAGHLYTGNRLGDIVRFKAPDYKEVEVFCHIGGHTLGMAFAKNGDLYVCVGGMGLYAVSPTGEVRKLTDETNRSKFSVIDDSRLRLADDLDIAPDGKVYFSEATVRYEMHSWPVDALESRGNGRIICYDPATDTTRTVMRNLVFPNGVCLTHDAQSIFIAESWSCRINRYWISGPKAGTSEIFMNRLPGYPDNINRASDGTYWLALLGMRTPALDLALQMPAFRKRMARRLPHDEWLYPNINTGCVVKFNDKGEILDALWDFGGENHPMITSMREHNGRLFLGGISNNRVGCYTIPGADPTWSGPDSYWGSAA